MATLKEQIDSKFVKYHMPRCVLVRLRRTEKRTVQKSDGSFGDMSKPGLFMERVTPRVPFTDDFDPAIPEHAELIKEYDAWIEENPKTVQQLQITKVGTVRPASQVAGWDNMTADEIETVVRATKVSLLWAYEYELLNPEGAREDVLEVLEEINADIVANPDSLDEVPVL